MNVTPQASRSLSTEANDPRRRRSMEEGQLASRSTTTKATVTASFRQTSLLKRPSKTQSSVVENMEEGGEEITEGSLSPIVASNSHEWSGSQDVSGDSQTSIPGMGSQGVDSQSVDSQGMYSLWNNSFGTDSQGMDSQGPETLPPFTLDSIQHVNPSVHRPESRLPRKVRASAGKESPSLSEQRTRTRRSRDLGPSKSSTTSSSVETERKRSSVPSRTPSTARSTVATRGLSSSPGAGAKPTATLKRARDSKDSDYQNVAKVPKTLGESTPRRSPRSSRVVSYEEESLEKQSRDRSTDLSSSRIPRKKLSTTTTTTVGVPAVAAVKVNIPNRLKPFLKAPGTLQSLRGLLAVFEDFYKNCRFDRITWRLKKAILALSKICKPLVTMRGATMLTERMMTSLIQVCVSYLAMEIFICSQEEKSFALFNDIDKKVAAKRAVVAELTDAADKANAAASADAYMTAGAAMKDVEWKRRIELVPSLHKSVDLICNKFIAFYRLSKVSSKNIENLVRFVQKQVDNFGTAVFDPEEALREYWSKDFDQEEPFCYMEEFCKKKDPAKFKAAENRMEQQLQEAEEEYVGKRIDLCTVKPADWKKQLAELSLDYEVKERGIRQKYVRECHEIQRMIRLKENDINFYIDPPADLSGEQPSGVADITEDDDRIGSLLSRPTNRPSSMNNQSSVTGPVNSSSTQALGLGAHPTLPNLSTSSRIPGASMVRLSNVGSNTPLFAFVSPSVDNSADSRETDSQMTAAVLSNAKADTGRFVVVPTEAPKTQESDLQREFRLLKEARRKLKEKIAAYIAMKEQGSTGTKPPLTTMTPATAVDQGQKSSPPKASRPFVSPSPSPSREQSTGPAQKSQHTIQAGATPPFPTFPTQGHSHASIPPAPIPPASRPPVSIPPASIPPASIPPAPRPPASIQPASIQPAPIHPPSIQPGSIHPPSIHPVSIQPALIHPASMHPAPIHPVPIHPAPMQPASMHPASMHPASMQPASRPHASNQVPLGHPNTNASPPLQAPANVQQPRQYLAPKTPQPFGVISGPEVQNQTEQHRRSQSTSNFVSGNAPRESPRYVSMAPSSYVVQSQPAPQGPPYRPYLPQQYQGPTQGLPMQPPPQPQNTYAVPQQPPQPQNTYAAPQQQQQGQRQGMPLVAPHAANPTFVHPPVAPQVQNPYAMQAQMFHPHQGPVNNPYNTVFSNYGSTNPTQLEWPTGL